MEHTKKCFSFVLSVFFVFASILSPFIYKVSTVSAQADNSVSIQVTPENPRENQQVSVSVSSINYDLDSADFVWKINNQTKKSGKGMKTFSFKVGSIGSVSVVGLQIVFGNGELVNRYISIRTSSVDLLFEAVENYTPPFYKGKKLPAPESLVKVVAMPNAPGLGKTVNAKDFIYTWEHNGKVISNVSGFGKQSYSFNMDYMNNEEIIGVTVRSPNGTYSSKGEATIKSTNPSIVVYQKTQDQLNLNKAVTNQDSVKNPTTLVSVPYFASAKTRNDKNLSYLWKINGEEFSGDGSKSELTIGANTPGESALEISIEHATKFFQDIKKSLKINI